MRATKLELWRAGWQRLFGYDFFISYAWKDARKYAETLERELTTGVPRFRCFLDNKEMGGGNSWRRSVERALRRSAVMILVGSPAAMTRSAVLDEIRVFSKRGRPLIPIDFDDTVAGLTTGHPAYAYIEERLRFAEIGGLLLLEAGTPSRDTVSYLQQSFRFVSVSRRQLAVQIGASSLLVALLAATGTQYAAERNARRRASDNESRALAALAIQAAARGRFTDAAVLSLASWPRVIDDDRLMSLSSLQAMEASLRGPIERFPPIRHTAFIVAVAFDATGGLIVTASRDGVAQVWNGQNGTAVGTPFVHGSAEITAATFSLDGTKVVTTSLDSSARVWGAYDGQSLLPPLIHDGPIYEGCFSPDGKSVLTASKDRTARLWDVETGRAIGTPMMHEAEVWTAIFSPDGSMIVTGSQDGSVRYWDGKNGRSRGIFVKQPWPVHNLEFSRSGRRLLATVHESGSGSAVKDVPRGGFDHVQVVELATTILFREPIRIHAQIYNAQFSPDQEGKTILISSSRGAHLWDTDSGKQLGEPILPQENVRANFSTNGQNIATCTTQLFERPGQLLLWDTAMRHALGPYVEVNGAGGDAVFSPDGTSVLLRSSELAARVLQFGCWAKAGQSPASDGTISNVCFNGQTSIVALLREHKVEIWDWTNTVSQAALTEVRGRYNAICLDHTGRRLLAAGIGKAEWQEKEAINPNERATEAEGDAAWLWAIEGNTFRGRAIPHEGAVTQVAFSPDGSRIITACEGSVRLADAENSRQLGKPIDVAGEITSISFTANGAKIVIVSGKGKSVSTWNGFTGAPLTFESNSEHNVQATVPSLDGSRFVRVYLDDTQKGTMELWETAEPRRIGKPLMHEGLNNLVTFSPSGDRILSTSYDVVKLLNGYDFNQIGSNQEHEDEVRQVGFSNCGARYFTISDMSGIRVWDSACGALLGTVDTVGNGLDGVDDAAVFLRLDLLATWRSYSSSDGRDDGRVRLWTLPAAGPHIAATLARVLGPRDLTDVRDRYHLNTDGAVAVSEPPRPDPAQLQS